MSIHSQHPEQSQEVEHTFPKILRTIDNIVDTSMSKWHAVTESRTTTLNSKLIESVKATVESSTAPLLEMMQVMAAQIEELTKIKAVTTQEQIRANAEIALRIQTEEEKQERLRKELEEKDFMVAQNLQKEEEAKQKQTEPVQAEQTTGMVTRGRKKKRKKIADLLSRVE
ncbi:protein FAM50A-B-like [Impatiens glandulifera]|uniref:protein FAM50A-B-like n=1 Tax=Impatiens glandulifera TaxID=253017 RepID=UPI001FB1865F|nr:protein FAM50A-B-like [Impatiens glandulifera]